jgi:hypothetical protein
MQETKQTGSKLLVIAITTAAIIAAVITTISISAAIPAFAKLNCSETATGAVCNGGGSVQSFGCGSTNPCHGGGGGRTTISGDEITNSGGGGIQFGGEGPSVVGGIGDHSVCDVNSPNTCSVDVGGHGRHLQLPGGNSDNAPPP